MTERCTHGPARARREALVKLLPEIGRVDVDSKDVFGQTGEI
jgi:hypothetical protein